MKKILCLIVFLLIPNFAYAAEFGGVITSYYGHRTHPLSGKPHYHGGMDIGVDHNTIVPSSVSGEVFVSGWVNGFGNAVYIRDKAGNTHIFAHNNKLLVKEGHKVTAGQKIALAGSTGNSTGPHVHYEVHDPSGRKIDPMPFALAAGWVLDGSITGQIGHALGEVWDSLGFQGYSFEGYHDIGKPFDNALLTIVTHLLAGLIRLDAVFYLIPILASIDLALRIQKNDGFTGTMNPALYINMIMRYGFVAFLFANWPWLLENFFKSFVLTISSAFTAEAEAKLEDVIMQPSLFLQKTINLLEPYMNYVEKGVSVVNLGEFLTLVLVWLFIHIIILLACFLIFCIGIKVIYFYLAGIVSLISLPFGVLKESKFAFKMGLGGIISASLELMITIILFFIVVAELSTLKTADSNLTSLITMFCNYIVLVGSVYYVPKIFLNYFGGAQ